MIQWEQIRYRGDRQDLEELEREYRIGDFLRTSAEGQRLADRGIKEDFLKNGVRLTAKLSPRIFTIIQEVHDKLGLEAEAEIFCLPSPQINAFAVMELRKETNTSIIGITSQALELLNDDEIRFILGHEYGHFIFGNHKYSALYRQSAMPGSLTVLPPMGEMIFLRWRKKAELSADRAGFISCGDLRSSATALLKTAYGLSEKNLELDINALMSQIDELKGKPELMEAEFSSHPLLPLRLKSMELFSLSGLKEALEKENGRAPALKQKLEDQVDDLMEVTRRHPHKPIGLAIMEMVALGGIEILAADRDLDKEEISLLIKILYKYFTDEPESVINVLKDERARKLKSAVKVVNEKGSHNDKIFILSRYADIAMADGVLMDVERDRILEIAAKLKLNEKLAYSILLGSAHTTGFNVDSKLNKISAAIRDSLMKELGEL